MEMIDPIFLEKENFHQILDLENHSVLFKRKE
jgi:hypothetical protein